MNNRIIAIIQARMGSTRFPDKMAAKLGGFPIIDWVIRRSLNSKYIDKLILATSINCENDYLIDRANKHGITSFRGSENNVLSRFSSIAKKENADIVVRICADNPFICGSEIDRIIKIYLENKPDYAFNHIPAIGNNYVDGVGAEVFSSDLLYKIAQNVETNDQIEHVTKYIWDHDTEFKIETIQAPSYLAFPNVKLDIDEELDLIKLENLLSESKQDWHSPEDLKVENILKCL